MGKKTYAKWNSTQWQEQVSYAKYILNDSQDCNARMLKIRLSMEAILKYLCMLNSIPYNTPNDAIHDLYEQRVLSIRDRQAFNVGRVFANKYCHYDDKKKDNHVDMSDVEINLAIQSWKYVVMWFSNKYFSHIDDNDKRLLFAIIENATDFVQDEEDEKKWSVFSR